MEAPAASVPEDERDIGIPIPPGFWERWNGSSREPSLLHPLPVGTLSPGLWNGWSASFRCAMGRCSHVLPGALNLQTCAHAPFRVTGSNRLATVLPEIPWKPWSGTSDALWGHPSCLGRPGPVQLHSRVCRGLESPVGHFLPPGPWDVDGGHEAPNCSHTHFFHLPVPDIAGAALGYLHQAPMLDDKLIFSGVHSLVIAFFYFFYIFISLWERGILTA